MRFGCGFGVLAAEHDHMTLSTSRRMIAGLIAGVLCALGVVVAAGSPAFADAGFTLNSPNGELWGTVYRINSHEISITANLWREGSQSESWDACWGYTEYGQYFQSGCNSRRYNNRPGTTATWSGLRYNNPYADIGWVLIKLYENGVEADGVFVWP
jgi:hypothetical protein